MTNIEKHIKINELLIDVLHNPIVQKFFDVESDEMLDEKIEVLEALKKGKPPKDILNYYEVLELYPKEQWD